MRKYLPSFILLALCAITPSAYFGAEYGADGAWLYHFTHANIFHLLSNFIFLAYFRPRWSTVLQSYLIASACVYLPFTALSEPTCGISAMCFAMIARRDVAWRVLNWRLLMFNTALIVLPHANWKIHLASYLIAFLIWKIEYTIKERRNRKN